MLLRTLWHRLRGTFFKCRLERDLDREVRFHLETLAEENMQKGTGASGASSK
jgi:hypothetical protein